MRSGANTSVWRPNHLCLNRESLFLITPTVNLTTTPGKCSFILAIRHAFHADCLEYFWVLRSVSASWNRANSSSSVHRCLLSIDVYCPKQSQYRGSPYSLFSFSRKNSKVEKKEQTILSPLGRGTIEDDVLPLRMGWSSLWWLRGGTDGNCRRTDGSCYSFVTFNYV